MSVASAIMNFHLLVSREQGRLHRREAGFTYCDESSDAKTKLQNLYKGVSSQWSREASQLESLIQDSVAAASTDHESQGIGQHPSARSCASCAWIPLPDFAIAIVCKPDALSPADTTLRDDLQSFWSSSGDPLEAVKDETLLYRYASDHVATRRRCPRHRFPRNSACMHHRSTITESPSHQLLLRHHIRPHTLKITSCCCHAEHPRLSYTTLSQAQVSPLPRALRHHRSVPGAVPGGPPAVPPTEAEGGGGAQPQHAAACKPLVSAWQELPCRLALAGAVALPTEAPCTCPS